MRDILDKRLTLEEHISLLGDDVYDVREIFENLYDCILHISKLYNVKYEYVKTLFDDEIGGYNYQNNLDDYYSVSEYEISKGNKDIAYVGFRSGRVAVVEFY